MKKEQKDFSYYQLKLQEHIEASFPEKLEDTKFIGQRARWAANAYEGAFRSGNGVHKCDEIADYILYEGLHFSKYDSLFDVLTNEFTDLFFDFEYRDFALKILPICAEVFAKYDLADDFAYSNDYDLLYTELTGFIAIWIEKNGIQ
ncbi:DUF1896 domain-containing protein [Chryseobacterium joostei]|uniref:DUF1896 domain-containing protein n=1 Tax=Chryseobacterium joostei TaxID=112234 RepID=A0A1N7HT69_9FLAO|nr:MULTISPECIES: DUF1896 domain-containing protein [Chryseobacterium]AZA99209.1 DUF1896 domain-containing protein [Chryseobacterium joostei]RXM63158.1 DUF1896 domain-containing protein [Chryseobacterium sp. CH1]SIS27961.1 protein of unknown function [Chryseobacterium joostei]